MIIKSLSRKSNPGQLIKYATRYLMKDGRNNNSKEHMSVLVKHNIRSNTVEGFITEFRQNEAYRIYRRKDSIVLFHTILSFNPKDKQKTSKAILKDIASKFIELRSPTSLNLAVAHLEKQHTHIHLITSGVQVNGRSSRVSKQAFANILKELETYQQEKYPELIYSLNNHSKILNTNKQKLVEHFKVTRKNTKLQLHTELSKLFIEAKTIKDLSAEMSAKGYPIYERNGRPQGIEFGGKKYRFSNLGFTQSDFDFSKSERSAQVPVIFDTYEKYETVKVKELSKNDIDTELEAIQSLRRKSKERDNLEKDTDTGRIRSEWGIGTKGASHDFVI